MKSVDWDVTLRSIYTRELKFMGKILDIVISGGPTMIPMLGLSVLTIACALERTLFWLKLISHEKQIVHDVLTAARVDLEEAATIASYAKSQPIGRVLRAPLYLRKPTPETFRLAMEAAADKEFVKMHKGDKLFETTIAAAPLFGLLGTVTGLIHTFSNLQVGGGGGGTSEQATKAAAGIGEALITTATGMLVAIMALLIFRVFVSLQSQQMDYFTEVGNELELIYRQVWYEPNRWNSEVENNPEHTVTNSKSLKTLTPR
jgi:biopolymer transport protein ExbB